jgi:polyisoprenyl-phosphate glycosyltransferase
MNSAFRPSIAIPLHNEETVLPELLRQTLAALDQIAGGPHEVVFVDDGSTDRTFTLLEEGCAAGLPHSGHLAFVKFRASGGSDGRARPCLGRRHGRDGWRFAGHPRGDTAIRGALPSGL